MMAWCRLSYFAIIVLIYWDGILDCIVYKYHVKYRVTPQPPPQVFVNNILNNRWNVAKVGTCKLDFMHDIPLKFQVYLCIFLYFMGNWKKSSKIGILTLEKGYMHHEWLVMAGIDIPQSYFSIFYLVAMPLSSQIIRGAFPDK